MKDYKGDKRMKIGTLVEWYSHGWHRIGVIIKITKNKYGKEKYIIKTNDGKLYHPWPSKLYVYK